MNELVKLKQLRQIKGLTQAEAGEGIGMEETSSRKILVKRLSGLRD